MSHQGIAEKGRQTPIQFFVLFILHSLVGYILKQNNLNDMYLSLYGWNSFS